MKRHPALTPLSSDHQHALAVALQLRRAEADSVGPAAAEFLEFWEPEGRLHFRVEEEILLPAFAVHGDPQHPLVVRALVDHVVIRRDAARAHHNPDPAQLRELGERLAAHVRLEERELFPLIERTMPEPDLDELGDRLREATRR